MQDATADKLCPTPSPTRRDACTGWPGRSAVKPRVVRRRALTVRALPLLAALLLLGMLQGTAALAHQHMALADVVIGDTTVRVEVADTPELQALGLGGRKTLGPKQGMLFVYAEKERHTFWMKRMVIAIDIIWLDNGTVVHVEHDVPPPQTGAGDWQLPVYKPDNPGNLVLELAAGRARALGLSVGQQVTLRFDVQ